MGTSGVSSDYLNLYQNNDWSYIYFANNSGTDPAGGLDITEEGNTRLRIINRQSEDYSYNYGMKFTNTDFDHGSQEYGFYFDNDSDGNPGSNYAMYIRNDGNSYYSRGILLQAGADTIGGNSTYFMKGLDGNGTDMFMLHVTVPVLLRGVVLLELTLEKYYNQILLQQILKKQKLLMKIVHHYIQMNGQLEQYLSQ